MPDPEPSGPADAAATLPLSPGPPEPAALLDLCEDAVLVVDSGWRILYRNAAARFAAAPDADHLWTALPGLDTTPFGAGLRDAMLTRTAFEGEAETGERVFRARAVPLGGGLAIALHDLGDLRRAVDLGSQALAHLAEARDHTGAVEERHRLALTAAELGDWQWDAASDVMNLSPRARTIFGVVGEAPTTRTAIRAAVTPEDLAIAETVIGEASARHDGYRVEYRYRRPNDGVLRWIASAGQPRIDEGGRITGIVGVVQDITDRKLAEDRQSLLVRELHHRVKNTLANVQAIAGATARSSSSVAEFNEAFVGRLVALATTHDLLTAHASQTVLLEDLLAAELRPYDAGGDSRIVLTGPAVELSAEVAVPLGMAIHEMASNAAKYGALSRPTGRVEVAWSLEETGDATMLVFAWREEGGPPVAPPVRTGFGSRLLRRVLATQLQAEVQMSFPPQGFTLTMRAPLRAVEGAR